MKILLATPLILLLGACVFYPKEEGRLQNPPAPFASSENNKADTFAGIDFWKDDRLHIPNFAASKNLVQNPSFEEGLHYYRDISSWCHSYPGEDRDVYSVDDSTAHSGNRSLKIKTWKDYTNLSNLSTFTIPVTKDNTYTISFYAKSPSKNTCLMVRHISGKFDWQNVLIKGFRLSNDWQRYECSLKAVNRAETVLLTAVNGDDKESVAWLDDLQFEEGDKATAYVQPPVAVALIDSANYGILDPSRPFDIKLRINAVPNSKGEANWTVEDFFYQKAASGSFLFATDAKGDAMIPLGLDGRLATGMFNLRTEVKLDSGASFTEFHKLAIMDAAPAKCQNKSVFGMIMINTPILLDAHWKRLAFLGIGSTNYWIMGKTYPILEKYGIVNSGCGVISYGPNIPKKGEWRNELANRLKKEPYSESLQTEVENYSYELAKSNPWVRTWFLQGESDCPKFKCQTDGDYEGFAKLILACRKAVLKADPTLKFIAEGGPCNMYAAHGTTKYGIWLSALEKLAPDVRFEALAIHPYRPVPENPDFDADAKYFIEMVNRHGYKTEPVYWNEGIYNCPWNVPEWGLEVEKGCTTDFWYAGTPTYHMGWAERMSAAYWARSWLVALKYSDRVKQLTGWWDTLLFLDYDGGLYAMAKVPNTLCKLLGDAKFKKDIRFAVNCRTYVFEDAQGRPVAALWSHVPEVDKGLEKSPVAEIRFPDGVSPEFIDLMENHVTPAMTKDGAYEIPVTPFPLFIRGKAGSLDKLCESLADAKVPITSAFPLSINLKPDSTSSAKLTLANQITRKFEGEVQVGAKRIALSIPGLETQSAKIELPEKVSLTSVKRLSLPVKFVCENGVSLSRDFSMNAFAISNAKDWDSVPWIEITNHRQFKPGVFGYKGDLKASYKMRWDEKSLHLLLKVADDKLVFPTSPAAGSDFHFDGLQFYLDTFGDNGQRKREVFGDFNDYCYQISWDAELKKPRVYRECAPEPQIAGGMLAPKSKEVDTLTEVKFTMLPDGYCFDVSFPARAIAPMQLKSGSFARIGFTVNDNDGDGRKGALVNTTETQSSEPFSNPDQMVGMTLVDTNK